MSTPVTQSLQQFRHEGHDLTRGMIVHWNGPFGLRHGVVFSDVRGDNHHPHHTDLNVEVIPEGESKTWIKYTEITAVEFVMPDGFLRKIINHVW